MARLLTQTLSALENCQNAGKLKDEKIAAFDGLVRDLRDLVEIEKSRIAELKAANADRAGAGKIDEERISNYEKIIKSFESTVSRLEAEVVRLRGERDSLRKSRNTWAVLAFVIGAALGIFGARR